MSSSASPRAPGRGPDFLAAAVRVLLAGVFIYMGLSKALAPVEFLKLVRQYGVFEQPWALNFIAAGLPWLEVVCGLLLLFGVAVRGTAVLLLGLLAAFTTLVVLRAMQIHALGEIPFCAIQFDCGCGAGEVLICRKIAENALLAALSLALIFARGQRWCVRHTLLTSRPKA